MTRAAKKSLQQLTEQRRKLRLKRWQAFVDRPEALEEICCAIAEGNNLARWCRENEFPYMTVSDWLRHKPHKAIYDSAREVRADAMFDEIEEVARREPKNQMQVAQQRLLVDTLKWQAQRLNRFYTDRVQMAVTGKDDGPIEHSHSVKTLSEDELEHIARSGCHRAAAAKKSEE